MKDINVSVYLEKIKNGFVSYRKVIFVVFIILLYSALVFRINQLSSQAPTDDQISQKLSETKRPKIDQDSLDKIQKLQDESVSVQALFKEARDNPFSDE
ncbi:MAG: hypothetical protein AAB423_02780 [Patescibacteria group bacterium]